MRYCNLKFKMDNQVIKIGVLGDGRILYKSPLITTDGVGKTSMLITYVTKTMPDEYIPT